MTAVLLFSGGMDSTIALYWAVQHHVPLHGICFVYGQRHIKEVEKAAGIWNDLEKRQLTSTNPLGTLRYITLSRVIFGGYSSLLDNHVPVSKYKTPEEAVAGTGEDTSYIPGRNAIFLSIAASHLLAWSPEGGVIVTGVRGRTIGPVSGFPDCTTSFVNKMSKALTDGTFGKYRTGRILVDDHLTGWVRHELVQFLSQKNCLGVLKL